MKRIGSGTALFIIVAAGSVGCARAQTAEPTVAPPGPVADSARFVRDTTVHGTLDQNDIAIRLRNDELEIRFVPLDARVTSLLSRDGAVSLQRLVARWRAEIDSAGRSSGVSEPGLALVTFFGQRDGVRFDAELVTLTVRNQLLRPLAIVPISPQFSSRQLEARQTVMAIYLYEELLPVWDPFTVSYEQLVSHDWERRLPTLERERARLAVRTR